MIIISKRPVLLSNESLKSYSQFGKQDPGSIAKLHFLRLKDRHRKVVGKNRVILKNILKEYTLDYQSYVEKGDPIG